MVLFMPPCFCDTADLTLQWHIIHNFPTRKTLWWTFFVSSDFMGLHFALICKNVLISCADFNVFKLLLLKYFPTNHIKSHSPQRSEFCFLYPQVSHFKEFIPKAFPTGDDLILDAEVLLIDTNTGSPLPFGTLGKHKV